MRGGGTCTVGLINRSTGGGSSSTSRMMSSSFFCSANCVRQARRSPCALRGSTLGVRCASHLIRTSSIDVLGLLGKYDVSDLDERCTLTSGNHIGMSGNCPFHLTSHGHPLLGVNETISQLRDLRQHTHRRHVAFEAVVRGHLGHLGRAHLTPLTVRATTCSPSAPWTGRARCAPMIASAERRRSPRALTKDSYETNTSRYQASLHENPFEYNKSHQQIGNQ